MNHQATDARLGSRLVRFAEALPTPLNMLLRLWVLTAPVGSILIASDAFLADTTSLATTGVESLALTARAVYPAFLTLWLCVVGFWIFTKFSATREAVSFERLAYPFISISFALYFIGVHAWIGGL